MIDRLPADIARGVLWALEDGPGRSMDTVCAALSCRSMRDAMGAGSMRPTGKAAAGCSHGQWEYAVEHLGAWREPGRMSVMRAAAHAGSVRVLETMLRSAPPPAWDRALSWLAASDMEDGISMVARAARASGLSLDAEPAMCRAARRGKLGALRRLRSLGFRRTNCVPVISAAARGGRREVLEWLIERQSREKSRLRPGQWTCGTVARAAVLSGSTDVLSFFVENGLANATFLERVAMHAVRQDRVETLRWISDATGADATGADAARMFAIEAVSSGAKAAIELWVGNGASVDDIVSAAGAVLGDRGDILEEFVGWVNSL